MTRKTRFSQGTEVHQKVLRWGLIAMVTGICFAGSVASAKQAEDPTDPNTGGEFKPSHSGHDPDPRVPGVGDLEAGVHQQAGTGGDIAFAEAGVVELGGSGGLDVNSNGHILSLRPSIGWFLVNNLELSGIIEMQWARLNGNDTAVFGIFGEPSYHIPFTNRLLIFGGLGLGGAFNDSDWGFALRPRLGLDILVGRSGIFRPAVDVTWSTADLVNRGGTTLVGIKTSFGVTFGYSVML